MIGDREYRDPDADEELPPVDAMLRFDPPQRDIPTAPAWVERRGRIVVVRHTWPEGDATTERTYPTTGKALIGYAYQAATLRQRGYTDVPSDG